MVTSRGQQVLIAGLLLAALSLGLRWGGYPGTLSTARFFIVTAFALAVVGWRLGRARLMRCAALVAAASIAFHFAHGLTGGAIALALAGWCFWVASRDLGPRDSVSPSAG